MMNNHKNHDKMKKAIRPPENWQDFETLCKKLFGEIWGCPLTIKKNGRLGQPQNGVDVYGKPKGENEYWGIQCKGKDNYTEQKLTESEIDAEISKALKFEPKLRTFVFATTAAKDVSIEKYIRLKDQENCANNSFQIVLYCWQDIADLIEEYHDTFNWYVNEFQFKDKYDIQVSITTKGNNGIINPKFLKCITEYKLKPEQMTDPFLDLYSRTRFNPALIQVQPISLFGSNKINHGWCSLTTFIQNIGGRVIEDWKFTLQFSDYVRKVDDDFTKNILMYEKASKFRTTWAFNERREILFEPLNNAPLIQKDTISFKCFCIPKFDSKEVLISWQLLARDFNSTGEFKLIVEPTYEIKRNTEFVMNDSDVRTCEEITEYITYK